MDLISFLIFLIVALVVLSIVYYLWQTFVAPHVPAPLNWAIPMIVALLFILYLLLMLIGRIPVPVFRI